VAMPVICLTVPDVIEAHFQIMESMGEPPSPLRSEALLESAIMKPQATPYYAGTDLFGQAALLAIGISRNQPFLDGNKRTVYASLKVFLTINGFRITATNLEIARQVEADAEREGSLDEATERFAVWLRERVKPRE